jgi:hypothetical protein
MPAVPVMAYPTPPWLKEQFWLAAGEIAGERVARKLPPCWLSDYDLRRRKCSTEIQACHLIAEQRIRNVLVPQLIELDAQLGAPGMLAEVIPLLECDPRLAVPGCTRHHPRFDNHATPELVVPRAALPEPFLDFIADFDGTFDADLERKFQ